jgi:S-adenosylmethionine:tRNA ribosyltransferase-isomerase
MKHPGNISILDYTYELPAEKIALQPLPQRDASKLLIYKNRVIEEDVYSNIDKHLPAGSLLVFNDTRVINARLRFHKPTGATIEIFCLEPFEVNEYSLAMAKKESAKWKCLIGGVAKWKEAFLEKKFIHKGDEVALRACIVTKVNEAYIIEFSWQPSHMSFAEMLEEAGDIPLPPYLKRAAGAADAERYQTIYAAHEGSVAAPTAGLHFTQAIFDKLAVKNIARTYVTLHVGAGTFKPVKAGTMEDHEMHAEWIDVELNTIRKIAHKETGVIAVGTTSLRTIESLYWLGVKVALDPDITPLSLQQWEVYDTLPGDRSPHACLSALISWMEARNMERIFTRTQILIAPGYRFRIADALITNFHQPRSTLLLLVAAAVGDDWKKIYDHALEKDYRFLSYGDGNLIYIDKP